MLPVTSAPEMIPSPPWLDVAVHVDAAAVVAPRHVAAQHRPVAAVGDVDAVLVDRAAGLVVLDQQVVDDGR